MAILARKEVRRVLAGNGRSAKRAGDHSSAADTALREESNALTHASSSGCKQAAFHFIWRAMTPQDITKLIVRTSLKDRAAFDLLYRQTSAKLFGVCLRVLNDRAEAEEALQEVYVKIWTKADRFAVSDLSPISWLVAVARNHAIDRVRARRRPTAELDTALDVADPAPGPEAMAVAGDEKERIHQCLEELEKDRSAAVQGAYLRGESYAELAARFSVPLNTMRTWLRRSLMKLRECLER
jgi:RNA polymerase sigma-70 factor (ECF subfamily)